MAAALNAEGIETDLYWIGNKPIGGCIGCYQCAKKQKCVFEEGLQIMRYLGRNMAWMLKRMEAGKQAGIPHPAQEERRLATNFIR